MSLILNLTSLKDKLRTARYLRNQLYKSDTEQNETMDEIDGTNDFSNLLNDMEDGKNGL